jgi:hypothetical protein
MRNTSAKFFKDNLIIPVDDDFSTEEVLKQLNVLIHYKNFIDIDKINSLFDKSVAEIKKTITNLSTAQKETVYLVAVEMFKGGELIDLNKIDKIFGKPIMDMLQKIEKNESN